MIICYFYISICNHQTNMFKHINEFFTGMIEYINSFFKPLNCHWFDGIPICAKRN